MSGCELETPNALGVLFAMDYVEWPPRCCRCGRQWEAFFPRDSSMCQHSHRTVTKTLTVWRSCRMAFPQAANSTQATSWYQTSITPPLRLAAISKELGSRLQR